MYRGTASATVQAERLALPKLLLKRGLRPSLPEDSFASRQSESDSRLAFACTALQNLRFCTQNAVTAFRWQGF
jgi:hypothetical protein